MKRYLALVIPFLALGACNKEKISATVDCKVNAGPSVDCKIEQTKGKSEIEVCWDFKVTCANGATLEVPTSCAKVKEGGTSELQISADSITIEGSCEGATEAVITNMKWSPV